MSEQSRVKNEPVASEPAVQRMLESVFEHTDREFSEHLTQHWEKLGNPKVQHSIAQESDIPETTFSRWHLMNNLGDTRATLAKCMATVHDGNSFGEQCLDFIDREMEHLFFVSNNVAQARIAHDYFDRFLTNAIDGLLATGKIDKPTAESYEALREYYDIGFESYNDLRDLVQVESGGVTTSLVAYALSKHLTPQNKNGLSQLLRLSHTDANASGMVAEMSRGLYQELLSSQPIFHGETIPFDYHGVWFYRGAMDIAQDQFTSKVPERYERHGANARTRQHMQTQIDLYNEAIACLQEHGEVEGLIEARQLFDTKGKALLDMPDTYDELLDYALIEATVGSKKALSAAILTDAERRLSAAQPKSARLGEQLWPHLDDPRVARAVAEELNDYWHDEFSRCASPVHIGQKADMLLDELAQDVFYGISSPATFLHAANYLSGIRRSLGGVLHEEGKFRPEDFATLKRVEQKCLYYYESFYLTREWMLEHTHGAYDRLGTQEYAKYAAETGRLFNDLEPEEWKRSIMPFAQQEFGTLLQNMNVRHKGCDHLLVPLIAAKARTIAGKELGEPTDTMNDEARDAQYEKVWAKAGELLRAALGSLPQRDVDHGHKIKVQPFTADHVAKLMQDLDQKIKIAGYRGTAH